MCCVLDPPRSSRVVRNGPELAVKRPIFALKRSAPGEELERQRQFGPKHRSETIDAWTGQKHRRKLGPSRTNFERDRPKLGRMRMPSVGGNVAQVAPHTLGQMPGQRRQIRTKVGPESAHGAASSKVGRGCACRNLARSGPLRAMAPTSVCFWFACRGDEEHGERILSLPGSWGCVQHHARK